ncbi:MAG: CRISPR-associated endonuclease Cas2 [Eubacteriales bacterium]|nr:CRISPR-associated endonuclease Cas2 [Eubacteriales bacterium]
MLMLVTYDVSTQTPEGKQRLRRVAKCCQNKGIRVQNSVFECVVDAAQWKLLRHELEELIDPKADSLRFYRLGERTSSNVEHIGAKVAADMEDVLIL